MIPSFLLQKEQIKFENKAAKHRLTFIDKTMKNSASFIAASFTQLNVSSKSGLLQLIDPRIKLFSFMCFVVIVSLAHSISIQLLISAIVFLLYALSKIKLVSAYKKILLIGFLFGFLIFVPASLNIFTKGKPIVTLLKFPGGHIWWIYSVPKEITITHEGIQTVLHLTLKVCNSVSIVMLLIYTTTFERVIKSLSFFKIPGIFLLTLTLAYKYIFVLSHTVGETYCALKMRWWNRGTINDAGKIVAGRIGYLFRKSWERYELLFQSMVARGFSGSVNFYYFDKLKPADYFFMGVAIALIFSIILLKFFYA